MEDMTHLLTIKIPIRAIDDLDGRLQARETLDQIRDFVKKIEAEMKLQRIEKGKPPVGITI